MQRTLSNLANRSYDLLIIGGGIYGACTAWEAVSRGLSVALVEKQDFGSATSANSLKIIHGGLRYLQHADLKRMRESIRERKNLLRIAPHLIHPLPILVPTYGHGVKGREAMTIALLLNDLISCDRNWVIENTSHHIPTGQIIAKNECLKKLPGLSAEGLTGGALFTDAQVYNSERLTLAFLRSAHDAGAQIANYATVKDFIRQGDRIAGATVHDELTGQDFDIQAKLVINTSGPWIHQLQALAQGKTPPDDVLLAKAVNVVVPKFIQHYAVGLSSKVDYRDQDALVDKGSRFLFTVPWRDASMLGTWYFPYRQSPEQLSVSGAELQICLDDINAAYPPADLTLSDISYVHCGLLPSSGVSRKTGDVQLAKHYHLIDHGQDGMPGLLTVSGVKYTTARDVAEKVIGRVGHILRRSLPASKTHQTPVYGGAIDNFDGLLQQANQNTETGLSDSTMKSLVYTYGTEYQTVLDGIQPQSERSSWQNLLASQVRYAVHQEMAQHLSDVVLRRTDLGSARKPEESDIAFCAEIMAVELAWSEHQYQEELEQVHNFYAKRLPQGSSQEVADQEVAELRTA
ncbi:glycerol-3-phosphate dehydrogenase/oxidase [Oscillatoria sp. CS-180]|uniref:glycerol-3-phosphate dehydrogenase/oxidase n=1 Tax=Oscillatoria sp. CS-180 TaxID=3021720 RepID=UPI00232DF217|nr:glycerol-3-phosphate dehydrogenase/oxidase [Oscillatoria sp. CS-180]MDB9526586.1 glycerol-3-phosphate dehydrogenase/oxidase [Oscillatoria sp. CS-180]